MLEEKVKMAEEEANLLAKRATEAQQEILRIQQENFKVYMMLYCKSRRRGGPCGSKYFSPISEPH